MTIINVSRQITVPRSAADCYAYLSDFSTCQQWDPGVAEATKITPDDISVGTEFDIQLQGPAGKIPMRYRITELQPETGIELMGEGSGFTVRDQIAFEALGSQQTRISYTAEMDFHRLPDLLRFAANPVCERIGSKAMAGLEAALRDEIDLPDRVSPTLAERAVLPAAAAFTQRGYRKLPHAGLSWRMQGKKVLITGPTSGIGLAAAKELARLGAELILVGRDEARMAEAIHSIRQFAGQTIVDAYYADLSLIKACKSVAAQITATHPEIDVLINNAGALPNVRTTTGEGHESCMAVNLLGPYVLTRTLLPALRPRRGRVINVVSGGLYLQPLDVGNLQFENGHYDGSKAYAQAKRALLTFTEHMDTGKDSAGIAFHAMHPGWAATPGVARSLPRFDRVMGPFLRTATMGADTIVWLASHPELGPAQRPGVFWFDRALRPTELLSGTGVDAPERSKLMQWLEDVCAC